MTHPTLRPDARPATTDQTLAGLREELLALAAILPVRASADVWGGAQAVPAAAVLADA